ncbi:hypothetical protein D046_8179B, partial [Vibrio parahaemolyticus V-223/04]
WKKK